MSLAIAATVGLLVWCHLVPAVWSHGYISMPPLRGGVQGSDRNGYCPHCGNGQTVCGDGNQWPDDSDFLNFDGGANFAVLEAGSIQEFTVHITAHHMGHFEFAICGEQVSSETSSPQDCFDQGKLLRADPAADCVPNDSRGDCQPIHADYPERWYLPPPAQGSISGTYTMRYKIPADLQCSKCTLQWRWWTGNSCVPAPNYRCFFDLLKQQGWDGDAWCGEFCGASCGAYEPAYDTSCGEEFRNCADVTVVPAGSNGGGSSSGAVTTLMTTTTTTAGLASSAGTSSTTTVGATAATTPAAGVFSCSWNRNCTESHWCNDEVYETWCPERRNAQECESPQCVLGGIAASTASTASSGFLAKSSTTTTTTAVTETTTTVETASVECQPIGDCGALGFCNQIEFANFCALYSAGSCPAPFCMSI